MKPFFLLKYLLFFLLFAGTGCQKIIVEDQALEIGKTATIHLNQLYFSADKQYSLMLTEANDSRCPTGVECIWAGEVSLKGEWTAGSNKTNFELHTLLKNMQVQPEGYTIEITDVKPYPVYGSPSKTEDLVVTLIIQKN